MDLSTPTHKFKEILTMYKNTVFNEEKLSDLHLHDLRLTSSSLLMAENVDIETVSKRLGHARKR